ncbi:phospholipid-binding protein MlaC [Snodgrassella alvi]|uniref:MlaC/ttg2D family ABC transporter substrate-binding protein n=1 Tax=Snodgrassella TaxID=1193515 RepID=UPI00226A55B0|nr:MULTISPECIES: ABC transporter substrate-binding protein [unclassified Snodgrassella]MCX8748512.1 ABC transporter substrate-binding protein [Snodgrassella sp. B3088]MCX8753603.1 ABC transporter substrate-binding protein [Snodgrassella sp. B3837]
MKLNKSKFLGALSICIMSISMAIASPQQAVGQLKENATQVLNILGAANGKNDEQVRRQAENYAIPYFDFERMTALAVGAPWRTATPAQQQDLTKEFKTLLIRTYSGTMLKFRNAKANVYNNPVVNKKGREIIVRVDVTTPNSKPVRMDYTMYQSGNMYRIYNVAVEGASLVTVYRNQFNQTISQKGIDGLVAELRAKNGR